MLVSVNIKGNSNFFNLAAHLCTRCVVVAPGIHAEIPGFRTAGDAVPPYHQLVDAAQAHGEHLASAWARLQSSAASLSNGAKPPACGDELTRLP